MKKLFTVCFLLAILFTVKGQDLVRFDSKDRVGFKNKQGEIVVPAAYDYPKDFHDGLLPIYINNKYGFIDIKGKIIIPCLYEFAANFSEGLAKVRVNEKYGYIDKTGKIIIPCKYDRSESFCEGLALASESSDDYYGYIDKTGKIIIPYKYKYGTAFYKGYAAVELDNTVRIIDITGKEIKKLKYESLGWFKEDVTNVKLGGKYGRIETATGKEIIPPIYDGMLRFDRNFINWVKLNNKWGQIDKLGNIILPIRYENIGATLKDNYRVEINGKYGVMNNYKKLTEVKYDSIGAFEKEFTMVKIGNKFGFIDSLGKELAPITYDYANAFSEGFASIFHKGHWSFLNTKGEELPLFYKESYNYQFVSSFKDGRCVVQFEGKIGLINKKGHIILAPLYDRISGFYDGIANVKSNNKWGVIDSLGNEIIPVEYDEIDGFSDDNIKAIKNGKEIYFDKTGKEIEKTNENK